jgi:gliding motility-associated protein GldM
MATGKETPRQKMINMMYLVLTAILALNVSSEILKGFVTVDESLEHSNKILSDNNAKMEAAFLEYVKQGNVEAKPYYNQSVVMKSKVHKTLAYIDSLKYRLIAKVEDTEQPDTVQMRYMKHLEDYDTPTYLFLGSDETKPINTAYSALDLKLQLNTLSANLESDLNTMQANKATHLEKEDFMSLKEQLKLIKPQDKGREEDGIKLNWEQENFYHLPAAAVLTNLDKLQTDLKNLEAEFLRVYSAASNKVIPKFNTLEAKVLAPTNCVQTGEIFNADILLSAGSTELTPDRMKVLLGAEYDTLTKKLTKPGQAVDIKDGIGRWQTITSSQGTQKLSGVIAYKKSNGDDMYFPFAYTYTVSPPLSNVGADSMNVFYVGINNPITASAAGILPEHVIVNVAGCGATTKSNGSGKYIVNVTQPGKCIVTVFSKTNGVTKQQGVSKVFRVKAIPQPVAKINGKPVLSTLEMNSNEISAIKAISAVCLGFEFPVNVEVKQAVLVVTGSDGTLQEEKFYSANLTDKACKMLRELKPGRRAWIEKVSVKINNQTFTVPDITIKKKV